MYPFSSPTAKKSDSNYKDDIGVSLNFLVFSLEKSVNENKNECPLEQIAKRYIPSISRAKMNFSLSVFMLLTTAKSIGLNTSIVLFLPWT